MPETRIADFRGTYLPEVGDRDGPRPGRILLSEKRVLLVGDDERVSIPLGDVFDVVVGRLPVGVSPFAEETVAIASYQIPENGTAIIGTDPATITRFRTVLFKALLDGSTVHVTNPAAVGGRRTDAPTHAASLALQRRAVTFEAPDDPLRIELSDVTHFGRTTRTVDGTPRPALEVQFTRDRQAVTAEVVVSSGRRMNLLGRYLRLEYSDLVAELADLELPDEQLQVLTALYSGAERGDLGGMVPAGPSGVEDLLADLGAKRMVADTDAGIRLTSLGRMAVSERVEAING